jgi:CelD/BcsL family acetyltransferase involved in cellulose biosynthesis
LYQRCFATRADQALTGETFAAFRRDVALRLAPLGRLLLILLRIDGVPVAGELAFLYGGTYYAYNACHDPAWKGEHVGTLLQWEAIRHAILAGCRDYDFLRGAEEYKTHWGTEPRRHVRIRLTRSSTKVRMLRAAARLVRREPATGLGRWAKGLGS